MAFRNSGQTTAPSLSASLSADAVGTLALAWLFPKSDGPVLPLIAQRGSEAFIGRDEACDVVLSGPDVSRRHAVVRVEGPHHVLLDLDSRNGTWVNGRRIESVLLAPSDVVRIGGWIGLVTREAGPFGSVAPGVFGGQRLREVLAPIELAARSDLPIVLEGQTGTGKELVARAIHDWSGRQGPFVAVNCAALPEALAEGELFGYRRGAFTGAEHASVGHFRAAQGGTLLLDEICDLPLPLQAKLLRVLQEREVQPLGEARPNKIDVRVLAAAQSSLSQAMERGQFRPDLLARLDGLTATLPPLRERRAEIPYLFMHLLVTGSGSRPPDVEARLVERLCLYDWPFNVRELSLLVKHLLVLHGAEGQLKVKHLPPRLRGEPPVTDTPPAFVAAPNKDAEAEPPDLASLVDALRESNGNVARAAQALGISRQRAYRMMQGRSEVDLEALRDVGQSP